MYTPPGATTLDKVTNIPQIRLALQGFGGTGKTWAALTFPNPIVLNLDRGLGAHVGRSDVIEVPMYDAAFCRSVNPNYKDLSDRKDIILKWLKEQATKLSPEQTLIIDNNSQIQNYYHQWYEKNKMQWLSKDGKVDGFAEYKQKIAYYGEILEIIKALPCHVIYLCHETEASIGKNAGKIRPLLTGQMGDELMNHFTDFFRQISSTKPDVSKLSEDVLANYKMTKDEMTKWLSTFPRNTVYYWQTDGDSNFDGKCSSMVNFPKYIPATYESYVKYRRPISNGAVAIGK